MLQGIDGETMTQEQLQEIFKPILINNIGNKLTPELIAGMLASISGALMHKLAMQHIDSKQQENG